MKSGIRFILGLSFMLLFTPALSYAQAVTDKNTSFGMVQFLDPPIEEIKMRNSSSSAHIDYPVNKADILPGHGNNAAELRKIDALMQSILTDPLVTVKSITITGHSSPDGAYAANERLARRRSEEFRKYLTAGYPLENIPLHTRWVAEDWDGVSRLVEASDAITEKQKVLDIIHDPAILPDAKDARLQQVPWWSGNYKIILERMYPQLRRIEVRTDYVVRPLSDSQARELLYSRPEALSLEEMMRVASSYEPGSKPYREICEIAVRHFPGDAIAANNAAAAALLEGDTGQAFRYLEQVDALRDGRTLVNRGVAHYLAGDTAEARADFAEACRKGIPKGCSNLRLLDTALYEENPAQPVAEVKRTAAAEAPVFFTIASTEATEGYRFALKTNLLYDIALLPNLAMEFPLGGNWSVEVEGQWSWWNVKTTHNNCWRIQSAGLEARKWFGARSAAPLTGHYLGLYGMAGTYDVKFRDKNGYLSDMSYSAGLSYGYSLPVARRFNLEFGIAAGYLGGKYNVYGQYDPQSGFFPLREKKDMHYFGLTKAKVSLVWMIGGGKH